MPTQAQFWDKIARKYAKNPVRDPDAYEQTLDRVRSYLRADDHVLELGCGTGTTALKLADAVAHVSGTDISSNMIEIAREKSVGNTKVDFSVQALPDGRPPQPRFDVVMGFNLLHLVEDIDGTLNMVHGLLEPGQYFISKTICLAEKGGWMRLLVGAMRAVGKAPFVRFYKIDELEDLITGAGFEIVETGNYPLSPPNHFVVARRL